MSLPWHFFLLRSYLQLLPADPSLVPVCLRYFALLAHRSEADADSSTTSITEWVQEVCTREVASDLLDGVTRYIESMSETAAICVTTRQQAAEIMQLVRQDLHAVSRQKGAGGGQGNARLTDLL